MKNFQIKFSTVKVNDGVQVVTETTKFLERESIVDALNNACMSIAGDDIVAVNVQISAPKPQ